MSQHLGTSIIKNLTNFGLSNKEIEIYLTLLELETATVFELAKQSGVNRSSAYVVLESLRKKALVGISDDKKVRRFIAASPETILDVANSLSKKQEQIKLGVESIIPDLKALHKQTKARPIVKVFEGKNAAREVFWSLFAIPSKSKVLRAYANPVNIFKLIPDFHLHDKERGKRRIKMFAINPASMEMLEVMKNAKPHKPYEIALIPEHKFKFSSDLGIYEDKISIVSTKNNFGIIIESKEIADMLKASFDLAWEEAKRLDKKVRKKLLK